MCFWNVNTIQERQFQIRAQIDVSEPLHNSFHWETVIIWHKHNTAVLPSNHFELESHWIGNEIKLTIFFIFCLACTDINEYWYMEKYKCANIQGGEDMCVRDWICYLYSVLCGNQTIERGFKVRVCVCVCFYVELKFNVLFHAIASENRIRRT